MTNINDYKKRFYNLMESTMGDVKPLIMEVYSPPSALGRSRVFKDKKSFEAFIAVPSVSIPRDNKKFPSLVELNSNGKEQWNWNVRNMNPDINIAVTTMNGELSMMASQIFLVCALAGFRNLISDDKIFFKNIYNITGLQKAFKDAGGENNDASRIGIYSGQVRTPYVTKTTFLNYIQLINPIYTSRLELYAIPEAPTKPQ